MTFARLNHAGQGPASLFVDALVEVNPGRDVKGTSKS